MLLPKSFKKTLLLSLSALILSACGTAHIRTETHKNDLHDYEKIYINKVDIHSQEKSAESNDKLQSSMIKWELFARKELENYVERSKYSLAKSLDDKPASTLVVDLDIDLVYGNRAARYFGGFGAGKGSVDSVLTAIDPITDDIKFHAIAESDLSMGAFGGSMQKVLKNNIKKLIQHYPKSTSK